MIHHRHPVGADEIECFLFGVDAEENVEKQSRAVGGPALMGILGTEVSGDAFSSIVRNHVKIQGRDGGVGGGGCFVVCRKSRRDSFRPLRPTDGC